MKTGDLVSFSSAIVTSEWPQFSSEIRKFTGILLEKCSDTSKVLVSSGKIMWVLNINLEPMIHETR
jgi:hypothetical protein